MKEKRKLNLLARLYLSAAVTNSHNWGMRLFVNCYSFNFAEIFWSERKVWTCGKSAPLFTLLPFLGSQWIESKRYSPHWINRHLLLPLPPAPATRRSNKTDKGNSLNILHKFPQWLAAFILQIYASLFSFCLPPPSTPLRYISDPVAVLFSSRFIGTSCLNFQFIPCFQ